MEQPGTSQKTDPPTSTPEAERDNERRQFVILLAAKVLAECLTREILCQEEWLAYTKRLIDQTMEGLSVSEGFCPKVKSLKKVCKAVLKDLHKKFGSERLLKSALLSQDECVDAAIIQSLQAQIKDFSAELAEKAHDPPWRKYLPYILAVSAVILFASLLLAFIP